MIWGFAAVLIILGIMTLDDTRICHPKDKWPLRILGSLAVLSGVGLNVLLVIAKETQ